MRTRKSSKSAGRTASSQVEDVNPKTRYGATKPSVALVPSVAILHEAMAFEDGALKYGAYNWRNYSVSSMTYINAALRHIQSYLDGEEVAADSGVHHLGHARACLGIVLDAASLAKLHDDRPLPGLASAVQDELQLFKKVQHEDL